MSLAVQRVDLPGGEVSWTVLGEDYAVVGPVDRYLAYLSSVDRSPTTVRSYAFDLRDLFSFLAQIDVAWNAVRLEDLGRFVGWLRQSPAERAGNVKTTHSTTVTRASDISLQRRLELAHQRITQQTEEIRKLRDQLARAHGDLPHPANTHQRAVRSCRIAVT